MYSPNLPFGVSFKDFILARRFAILFCVLVWEFFPYFLGTSFLARQRGQSAVLVIDPLGTWILVLRVFSAPIGVFALHK